MVTTMARVVVVLVEAVTMFVVGSNNHHGPPSARGKSINVGDKWW